MSFSLVEFSVENFKIFKNKATFSMLWRKSKNKNYVFEKNWERLLKSSLIYWPNSSGKSTILDAIKYFKFLIKRSVDISNDKMPYEPFMLSDKKNSPTFLEMIFALNDNFYKYNFSLNNKKILSENLFEIWLNGSQNKILARNEKKIEVYNEFEQSRDVKAKTKNNSLFLTAASLRNNSLAIDIVKEISEIEVFSSHSSSEYWSITLNALKWKQWKKSILDYLQKADFCIQNIEVKEVKIPKETREKFWIPEKVKHFNKIDFIHPVFDDEKVIVGEHRFSIHEESDWTKKFFEILWPVIDVLEWWGVLCIDEFDNSLHPLLTKFIIDLFHTNNPKNAQLIVTTHDVNLLSYKTDFDKDHFWFTEKSKYWDARLYSLAEFKLRNDTEYQKKYLEWRFGGLPFIDIEDINGEN